MYNPPITRHYCGFADIKTACGLPCWGQECTEAPAFTTCTICVEVLANPEKVEEALAELTGLSKPTTYTNIFNEPDEQLDDDAWLAKQNEEDEDA